MPIIAHTYRYDELCETPDLQVLLRTVANSHVPKQPDAPVLVPVRQQKNRYEFFPDGTPGLQRVVIKPRSHGIKVELEVEDDDLPDEFCIALAAQAAREVLKLNNWEESPVIPFVGETFSYETLKATNTFQALIALDRTIKKRLKKLGQGSYQRPQDGNQIPSQDWEYSPKDCEVTEGSNWAHLQVRGSRACSGVTIYFYPECLQMVVDGLEVKEDEAQGWIFELVRDLISVCLDAWYYDEVVDWRTGKKHPGVDVKTGVTLN